MVAAILIFSLEAIVKLSHVPINPLFYNEKYLELYKVIEFAQLLLFIFVLEEIIIIAVVVSLARRKIEKIDLNNDEGIKEKEKIKKQNKNTRAFLIFIVLMTILFRITLILVKAEVVINDSNSRPVGDDTYYEYLQY